MLISRARTDLIAVGSGIHCNLAPESESEPDPDMRTGAGLCWNVDMLTLPSKFTPTNQKGPHFADPLEGWGEALFAKNQSHLALAQFAEAEK